MKRIKVSVAVLLSVCFCFAVTACGATEDFDASAYVKSSLDATYHQDYKEYAALLDISEEEAKADFDKSFQEGVKEELEGIEGLSEDIIAKYSELLIKANDLAKYEVGEAKKDDDGNYVVKVTVEPADMYQTIEKHSEEVATEKFSQGVDPTSPEAFGEVLVESVQKSIDNNTYGEATTVELTVKSAENSYSLEESEMDKIRELMFPE